MGIILVRARCDALTVLRRCREVLIPVIDHQSDEWPSIAEWHQLLPEWFVAACPKEMSSEQAEQWLAWLHTLSEDEQAAVRRRKAWALEDWLYWLEPDRRQWFWWDAQFDEADTLDVYVEVMDMPVPLGALDWLLRASGSETITVQSPA
ncbi:hypothetical protein [Frankia sp. Cas4]|uniref:hypothetical protein n=1 Tax=Frankia sp. Cas4 TaxID=3073927 RepID=UPI002AD4CB20|nr:hypothetical protein [Frankia sp. Cas4]